MIALEPPLFTYLPENGAVFLDDAYKIDFINELLCPDDDEIVLTFDLKSDLLGEA